MLSLTKNILALTLLALCLTNTTIAAKFPNAIEKEVVLIGKEAIAVAQLFGLSTDIKSSHKLLLNTNNSWAIYLLKQDTPEKLLNSNDPSLLPIRHNTIEFSPIPEPQIIINSFWLDQGTMLPNSNPGVYSFNSPPISTKNTGKNPWLNAFNNLNKLTPKKNGKSTFAEKVFYFNDGKKLTTRIWLDYSGEYQVEVLVSTLPNDLYHKKNESVEPKLNLQYNR